MPWDTSLRAVVLDTTQFSIFQCVPEQEIPSRPILKTLQPAIFQLSPLPWIAANASRKLPISKPRSSMLQLFVPEVLMRFARGVAAIFNIDESGPSPLRCIPDDGNWMDGSPIRYVPVGT